MICMHCGGLGLDYSQSYQNDGDLLLDAQANHAGHDAEEAHTVEEHSAPHLTKDIEHHPLQSDSLWGRNCRQRFDPTGNLQLHGIKDDKTQV